MRELLVLSAIACGVRSEQQMEDRLAQMEHNGEAGVHAVEALTSGNLEAVRARGKQLANEPAWNAFPDEARPLLEATRVEASRVGGATDHRGAADGLASLAQACGACHEHQEVQPSYGPNHGMAQELWLSVALRDAARWKKATANTGYEHLDGWNARFVALRTVLRSGAVPAASPWADQTLGRHMQAHFASATNGVWHVALGNLDQMRIHAQELNHEPTPTMPEALRPLAQTLAHAAGQWAASTDVATAAARSVEVATRCAACHGASSAIPPLTEEDVRLPELLPGGEHALAPYLMWVGLVVPSDVAWTEGATHLKVPAKLEQPTDATEYDAIAKRALTADGLERGQVWTALLQTCVPCHAKVGVSLGE